MRQYLLLIYRNKYEKEKIVGVNKVVITNVQVKSEYFFQCGNYVNAFKFLSSVPVQKMFQIMKKFKI